MDDKAYWDLRHANDVIYMETMQKRVDDLTIRHGNQQRRADGLQDELKQLTNANNELIRKLYLAEEMLLQLQLSMQAVPWGSRSLKTNDHIRWIGEFLGPHPNKEKGDLCLQSTT